MKNITLRKLQSVTNGRLFNAGQYLDVEISAIVADSRKVKDGCLFICIEGEKVDGHNYAKIVVENGALAVLAEKKLEDFDYPYLLVDSTFEATKAIAEFYRKNLDAKFIGVTGSVGKTSTKEFIADVLCKKYRVQKTQGNLNNEWGVPFTIFSIKESTEIAVVEMGINHFGEMRRLAKMVRPDVVVMTNIGQSHLEFLESRDGILRAKSEIFEYISEDGMIILNGDDDKLRTIESIKGIKPQFFGFDRDCSVYADKVSVDGINGSSFDIVMRENGGKMAIGIKMPVPGRQMIYNALAAYLVGINFDISPLLIKRALDNLGTMAGRNNIIRTQYLTIIDDCYNASPVSMETSIDVLKLSEGRKVAILGDMFELGENSPKFHYQVGQYVVSSDIDVVICVGELSEMTYKGAKLGNNDVYYFKSVNECIENLPRIIKMDDNILVKASHGMNFVKIVDYLKQ